MDKNSYLRKLEENLSSLSKEERDEAIKYYEEYFNDASDDEKVISELGDPEHLAQNILKDYNVKFEAKKKVENESNNRTTALVIVVILCIAFSPVIVPFFIGVIAAIFGIAVAGIAIVIASIAVIGVAIPAFITSAGIGMLLLGVGFILMAIGCVMSVLGFQLIPVLIKGIVCLCRKILGIGGSR